MTPTQQAEFTSEVAAVINRMSLERFSNTPDLIIARHLLWCLLDFNATMQARDKHRTPERT